MLHIGVLHSITLDGLGHIKKGQKFSKFCFLQYFFKSCGHHQFFCVEESVYFGHRTTK